MRSKKLTADERDALSAIYSHYSRWAAEQGLGFNLAFEDFTKIVLKRCFLCGAAPKIQLSGTRRRNCPIQVDPNRAFSTKNCVSACKQCRNIKGTMRLSRLMGLTKIGMRLRKFCEQT